MKKLFFLFLLFHVFDAKADWKLIFQAEKANAYIDLGSVKKGENYQNVNVLIDYSSQMTVKENPNSTKIYSYFSLINAYEINCSERMLWFSEATYFSENMAKGFEVISSVKNSSSNKNPSWQKVTGHGTLWNEVFNQVCLLGINEPSQFEVDQKIEKDVKKIIERNEKANKEFIRKEQNKKSEALIINTEKEKIEKDKLIKAAKEKCASIGFVDGTEKFGKCVLELIK